jgi:tetratricopeptide (TPR) repeat protein
MGRVGTVAALALLVGACAPTIQERVRVYNEAGVEHYQRGEFDRAGEDFKAALILQPRDTALLFNLAQCYDNLGQSDQAEQLYRQCLQQEPNHAEGRHALNVLLIKRGRGAEAQRMVQDWLTREPKLSAAYAEDAWLFDQEGDPLKAINRYQSAIYYDPHNTQALREMGRIYEEELNIPSKALHLYQTALDYDPHQAELVKRVNRLRSRGVTPPHPES